MSKLVRAGLAAALSVALLAPAPAEAQVTLGAAAGVSVASLGGDNVGSADYTTGFTGGAFARFPLAGFISLQPGLYLVQKGTEISEGGITGGISVDYFQVPLLARIGAPTPGPLGASLFLGPSFSFETSCEIGGSAGGVSASVDCADAGLDTKSFDVGLVGGAGLSFGTAGPLSIEVDALFDLGLSSISDVSGVDIKNRSFLLTAGLAWQLGM